MRVLIVQSRRLGDVLMITPLLRALREAHPHAVLDVLVEPACHAALVGNTRVSGLVLDDRARVATGLAVRGRRYDVVIDPMGKGTSALLALASGAPVRIGFDRGHFRWCYTHRVPMVGGVYSALEKLSLLTPLGIHSSHCALEPPVGQDGPVGPWWSALRPLPNRAPIAIAPVSRRPDKRWPPGRFAWACDRLVERTGRLLLPLCGPGEGGQIAAVVRQARRYDAFVQPPAVIPFPAVGSVLRRCAGYLGNDNAIRHVAVAVGLPTFAVFGRPEPRNWTPPPPHRHVFVGGRRVIATITEGEAASALDEFEQYLATSCGPLDAATADD